MSQVHIFTQIVFQGEGSMRAMLSVKNFSVRTAFSQHFRGKVTARDFLAVWDAVTSFDPDKGYRVVLGMTIVYMYTHIIQKELSGFNIS